MGGGSCIAVAVVWCRSSATAPIQSLAWELPYATGVALKRKKKIFLVKKKTNVCVCDVENRLVVPKRRREGGGWAGSLGLADANCCLWDG